jgi:hypothetical protein
VASPLRSIPTGIFQRRGPGLSSAAIEFVGTEGAVFLDDGRRDVLVSTVQHGLRRSLSTMAGQQVGHVYTGAMEAETRALH